MSDEQRSRVVQEALTWDGTPYHHQARIKGVGVDCGQLLAAVYEDAGVLPHIETGDYPGDWMLHRDEERYLSFVMQYAQEVDAPRPGDIAVFRFGRSYAHGSIVVEWPRIIHAYVRVGVMVDDAGENGALVGRPVRFFSPWGA